MNVCKNTSKRKTKEDEVGFFFFSPSHGKKLLLMFLCVINYTYLVKITCFHIFSGNHRSKFYYGHKEIMIPGMSLNKRGFSYTLNVVLVILVVECMIYKRNFNSSTVLVNRTYLKLAATSCRCRRRHDGHLHLSIG